MEEKIKKMYYYEMQLSMKREKLCNWRVFTLSFILEIWNNRIFQEVTFLLTLVDMINPLLTFRIEREREREEERERKI